MDTCKCCNQEISLNFCPNCGQRAAKRIDAKYIKDELQYTILHTNKGFFYSIKKIIKNPGKTALEFINGNRVHHYKPILLVVVLTGISAFLTSMFIDPVEVFQRFSEINGIKEQPGSKEIMAAMMKYQSLYMLMLIPFFALFSWIVFKKYGLNYYENVVGNAYLLSAVMVFSIVIVIPVQYLLRNDPRNFVIFSTSVSYLSILAISVWFFLGLYSDRPARWVIFRTFAMYGFMLFTFIFVAFVAGIILAVMNPGTFVPTN